MSARGAGLTVLAVLLVLVAAGYLGIRIRDAGQPSDDLDALRATRRDLEERAARLEELARAQRAPARVLDLVSMALPGPLWLESLSLRQKTVTISGTAAETWAVADFVESLHGTRGFGEPETRSITRSHDGYRFSLAFLIDPGRRRDRSPRPGRARSCGRASATSRPGSTVCFPTPGGRTTSCVASGPWRERPTWLS